MALILNIETTTNVCSVALSKDGKVMNEREDKEGRSHASLLSYFIRQILTEVRLMPEDLDSVCISKGPGSYTGLRIGVSTAKGLCYGADLPLISVSTLQSLARGLLLVMDERGEKPEDDALFVPMLDARRMEVYSAILDGNNHFLRDVRAEVIDENSFTSWLKNHPIYFFGNGVKKCMDIINHSNARFIGGVDLSARYLVSLAEEKYRNKQFEDLAYFEPSYLKDFIATRSNKNVLG